MILSDLLKAINKNRREKMSLLPLLFDIADEFSESPFHRSCNFGRTVNPNELIFLSEPGLLQSLSIPSGNHRHTGYNRRPRYLMRKNKAEGKGKSAVGKDGFQVCMDVQEFAPNEITVKTVGNAVLVEGKHEERQDEHGYISRQFSRRYTLPEGYNAKDVVTQLSSDGVLTVKAPPEQKAVEGSVRVVPIQQTGPAHLSIGNKDEAGDKKSQEEEKMTE